MASKEQKKTRIELPLNVKILLTLIVFTFLSLPFIASEMVAKVFIGLPYIFIVWLALILLIFLDNYVPRKKTENDYSDMEG